MNDNNQMQQEPTPLHLPQYVENVINKLETNNYEAFLVGGSLRDIILGKVPHDFDITTNALPSEIEEVFKEYKTLHIGKQFGTVVVVLEEGNIEITTYRTEGEYLDGRRPSEVFFANDIEDDLSRRDFTINAIAYNKIRGIVDPFNGREDIEKKIIRTVGNPKDRFKEDHLRILRAIRFATQLNFNIDEKTYLACKEHSSSLSKISMERLREEFFKTILAHKPSRGIQLMLDTGILNVLIPELLDTVNFDQKNPNHDKDVFNHTLCVLDNTDPNLSLRLAALFHDIGKPHTLTTDEGNIGHFYGHDKVGSQMSKEILTRLKSSNELISIVTILIKEHMSSHNDMKDRGLKRQISRVGKDNIFNLIDLQKADRLCSSPGNDDINFLIERENQIKSILEHKEPYEKNQLDIDGNDIINLGYKQGPLIGKILDYLMDRVMRDANLNEKHKLIEIVLEKFEK